MHLTLIDRRLTRPDLAKSVRATNSLDRCIILLQSDLYHASGDGSFATAKGTFMQQQANSDFRERIKTSFSHQGAMALLGAELTRIEQGAVEIELGYRPDLTQQHGFLHAGVISAALDSACTYAAYTMIEPDVSILTIEFKVNLLSPGKGTRFLFRGEITKPGSNIIVADGRAYAIGDGTAKLIASMTGTKMALRGREDIRG
jgi:uncharacterized protein (TIGR00369 family)